MDRKDILNDYYSDWNEDDRLLSRFGQVEFLTTIRFIEKYLKPGMKILEVGAGTGRYSHYFARKGYTVDAVELVERNIVGFKEKTLPNEKVNVYQGDAVNLCMAKDNDYDIVLHLGPMYHLSNESERKAAISEALRVTKPNGIVFMAYILNEMTVINYFFRNGHINEKEAREDIISSDWRLTENKRKHLAFYRIEDINALMNEFNVNRLHLVGTEMLSGGIRELLSEMSDEEFFYYTEYIYSICERTDMIGMSGHLLDIFEKKQ
ncbi:MAG: class I SAM-dependent methyltransferase [Oscillospiraceae bacterium]|nr:class I SAM-dependent methyltransferase [Oscillospiraceae bacterium]